MVRRSYSTIEYLDHFYRTLSPSMTFRAKTKEQWAKWRRSLIDKLTELLGGFPDQRCDLEAEVSERIDEGDYIREKVVFQSEPTASVPAYLLIPKKTRFPGPTLICQHGHGRGKDDAAGIYTTEEELKQIRELNYDYARQFAQRGYIVLAPDARCFGERNDPREEYSGCNKAAMNSILMGKTLIGMRVWDIFRCIDYLETREEVDPNRIGCMGLSGGGTVTFFSAILEKRIKAAVISGYFCTFKASIVDLPHCACNYVPNLLRYAEMPDLACLIAPLPLLFETGTQDPIFPTKAVQEAFEKVKQAYRLLGAEDRVDIDVFEGGHMFSGKKAFDWFERWL